MKHTIKIDYAAVENMICILMGSPRFYQREDVACRIWDLSGHSLSSLFPLLIPPRAPFENPYIPLLKNKNGALDSRELVNFFMTIFGKVYHADLQVLTEYVPSILT
jgi:hypothetical protein